MRRLLLTSWFLPLLVVACGAGLWFTVTWIADRETEKFEAAEKEREEKIIGKGRALKAAIRDAHTDR